MRKSRRSSPTKYKTFLLTEPRLLKSILSSMIHKKWNPKHLCRYINYLGVPITEKGLEQYLNGHGNTCDELSDEHILIMCTALGIRINITFDMHYDNDKDLDQFQRNYMPKELFPNYIKMFKIIKTFNSLDKETQWEYLQTNFKNFSVT